MSKREAIYPSIFTLIDISNVLQLFLQSNYMPEPISLIITYAFVK